MAYRLQAIEVENWKRFRKPEAWHSIANVQPLQEEDIASLALDIAEHGLHEPVVLFNDLVLDGRNRLLACHRAKVTPTFKELIGSEEEADAYAHSKNLERRHLEKGQRAMLAALDDKWVAIFEQELETKLKAGETIPPSVIKAGYVVYRLAKRWKTSVRNVSAARQVLRLDVEAASQVKSGQVSLADAVVAVGGYDEKRGVRGVRQMGAFLRDRNPDLTPDEIIELETRRLSIQDEQKQWTVLQRSEVKRREYVKAIRTAASIPPSEPILYPVGDRKTTVDWVLQLSDWHIGMAVPIEVTGGIYEQNMEVTRRQVDEILAAVRGIFNEAEGKFVRRLWVLVEGDMVENDCMRPAQLRQIDMPVVVQVREVSNLLTYLIRQLLVDIVGLEELVVDFVGGNHDRTTQKAGLAGLGETDFVDTHSFTIGHNVKDAFRHDPRVRVKVWEMFWGFRIFGGEDDDGKGGLRHVFEHGASIRGSAGSYGGIPFYGIVNAARHYDAMVGGVDIVWLGHLHTPYKIPIGQHGWIIGNGSLLPSSPFIQSTYKRVRRPQQHLVEIHRNHGVTAVRDLYCDSALKEVGAIWEKAHEDKQMWEKVVDSGVPAWDHYDMGLENVEPEEERDGDTTD